MPLDTGTTFHAQAMERDEHAGRCTPDVVLAEGNVEHVDLDATPTDLATSGFVVHRVEHIVDRDFEDAQYGA